MRSASPVTAWCRCSTSSAARCDSRAGTTTPTKRKQRKMLEGHWKACFKEFLSFLGLQSWNSLESPGSRRPGPLWDKKSCKSRAPLEVSWSSTSIWDAHAPWAAWHPPKNFTQNAHFICLFRRIDYSCIHIIYTCCIVIYVIISCIWWVLLDVFHTAPALEYSPALGGASRGLRVNKNGWKSMEKLWKAEEFNRNQ